MTRYINNKTIQKLWKMNKIKYQLNRKQFMKRKREQEKEKEKNANA